jgi:hypothetical protein
MVHAMLVDHMDRVENGRITMHHVQRLIDISLLDVRNLESIWSMFNILYLVRLIFN